MSTFLVDNPFTYKVMEEHVEAVGAIDIETTVEEDPFVTKPQLVSVAVTWDGYRSFVFKDDKFLEYARYILLDTQWIMHNGLFDRLMMRLFEYEIPLKHDTMAIQYLLDPDEPKSLEHLSEKYLGLESYKDVDYHNILEEPWEKVAEMNAEDVRRTYNLFRPLADELNKDKKLSRLYQWLLMPVINALIEVTEEGIQVAPERLQAMTGEYGDLVANYEESLLAGAPQHPDGWPKPSWWRVREHGKYQGDIFNPNSPKQVGYVLFDHFDLPVLTETDSGSPSTDADSLIQLEVMDEASEHARDWLALLRKYRKVKKAHSSYLESWPKHIDENSKMHPRFKPLHVVTGRLSSEKPNIQQVPRTKEFRSLFTVPEGYVWMKADYSQIELRIAAWLSNEPTLLEAYETGQDVHSLTAEHILGDSTFRQGGKTLNFGLLYGAGPKTLQRVARSDYDVWFSFEEASQYREDFYQLYPRLETWQKLTENGIVSTGQSRSALGRVRYLPHAKIPWDVVDMRTKKLAHIREGINHQVQSFAGDLLNMAVVRLHASGLRIMAAVHDEVDLIVPDNRVAETAAKVKEIMEDVTWLEKFGINLTVPVLTEVEVGPSWGEVEEYHAN